MDDDQPFYSPKYRTPPPRQPRPGRVMWTLTKGEHALRCELRDNTRVGAGVDCQIIHEDELITSQRCETGAGADFCAVSLRRDYLRDGCIDSEGTRSRCDPD